MDIIEQTKQLITHHNLAVDSYLDFNPFKMARESGVGWAQNLPYGQVSSKAQAKFLTEEKFDRIEEGWYGFDLSVCPPKWFEVLEEFWQLLKKDSPKFKVQQWKLKMGGIRLYTDNISDEAQEAINMLENVLYDKNLIW